MARRGPNRVLLAALALSLLAHVLVVLGPGWGLPDFFEEPPVRLDATLRAPPPPPPPAPKPPPPAPKPKPTRPEPPPEQAPPSPPPPQAEPVAPSPVEPPPAEPASAPQATTAGAGQAPGGDTQVIDSSPLSKTTSPPPPAVAPSAELPAQARLVYSFIMGQRVGDAVIDWQQQDGRYSLQMKTEPAGLVGLFKAAHITANSTGSIDAAGLRPDGFRYEQGGRTPSISSFDWNGAKIALTRGDERREFPLEAGAQDLLSLGYHLARTQAVRPSELAVATGKNFNRYKLAWLGDELVRTRVGSVRAVHVQSVELSKDQIVDVWISPQLRNLPVKIQITDRTGRPWELVADDFRADGVDLFASPQENQ